MICKNSTLRSNQKIITTQKLVKKQPKNWLKKKKKPSEVFKSLRCVDTHHCEDPSASSKEKIQAIVLYCHENEPVCLK